jgi:signal transduction histidine kinase
LAGKVLALALLPILAVAALTVYAMFSANGLLDRTLTRVEVRQSAAWHVQTPLIESSNSMLQLTNALAAMIEAHERSLLSGNPGLAKRTHERRSDVDAALTDFEGDIRHLAKEVRAADLLERAREDETIPDDLPLRLGFLERSPVMLSQLIALVDDANQRTIAALEEGATERAIRNFLYEERALVQTIQTRLDRMSVMATDVLEGVQAIQASRAESAHRAARTTAAERTRWLLVILAVGIGAVTLAAGMFAVRNVARPLDGMMTSMRRMAGGDMTAPIPQGYDDELGDMASALEVFKSYAVEAERANRAKSDFLATMSHELRTPLNAILGYAQVLEQELMGPLGNPRYRDYAADIHRSGRHLLDLISDVLDLSKVEAGHYEIVEESVDIEEVVDSAFALVRPQAQEKGVILLPDTKRYGCRVRGDRRAIRQILLNLIWNAVKYTPSGGTVAIELGVDSGCAITVRDTGPGIPEADRERVFEPFTRGRPATNGCQDGTGIGLALCRRLAALHDAELELISEEGVGTAVTLRFPAGRLGACSEKTELARDAVS